MSAPQKHTPPMFREITQLDLLRRRGFGVVSGRRVDGVQVHNIGVRRQVRQSRAVSPIRGLLLFLRRGKPVQNQNDSTPWTIDDHGIGRQRQPRRLVT